jgi:acetylglutamate kinase
LKIVLKIGGNEIDDAGFLEKVSQLAADIIENHHKLVIVHGGGKEITNLLTKLNIQTKFVKGLRYTDAHSLDVIEMVLSGSINKRLVKYLQQKKVDTIGLSGIDGNLLVARKISREGEDIGLVGEVHKVNTLLLEKLIDQFTVVLSPISITENCTSLNVNADYAAAAVASALKSELVIFLSDVPGVLKDGIVIKNIHEKEYIEMKKLGIISGGMVPKIEASLQALRGGALKAFITNVEGVHGTIFETVDNKTFIATQVLI